MLVEVVAGEHLVPLLALILVLVVQAVVVMETVHQEL
jgi:hypothetical protein